MDSETPLDGAKEYCKVPPAAAPGVIMQRLVPSALALITLIAAPAWADKLPLPKAAYSADVVFFTKGKQTTGHLNVDGPKERRQAKNAAGVDKTLIIRRDKGKAG